MANSTTNLDTLSDSQSSKMVGVNELLDAGSNALAFGRRGFNQTGGLTWALYGGVVMVAGTPTRVNNCSVTLTTNTTNYVEFNPTNTGTNSGVTTNTSGFTAGRIRLYTVVVDVTGSVSSYTDHRLTQPPGQPLLALVIASDANVTLSDVQARAEILDCTSSATLTATRDVVLPLNPRQWTVNNQTTGGQSLRFIGASGTGITVANAKRAILYADGTNIVRATADA